MALRFISEKRDGPWLLSLIPFDPHPPFDPPPEYANRYRPEDLPQPLFGETDLERQRDFQNVRQQKIEAVNPLGPMPEVIAKESHAARTYKAPDRFNGQVIKAAYYAMIEHIDHQLGRIVDYLEETGQRRNTLILFHSDHGELLGDHGLIFKGCRFFGYSPVDVPSQATMTFDGHTKMVVYHRHGDLGELFDLDSDPGEFDNLWNHPERQSFKLQRMRAHLDAVMATISPGAERVTTY